VCSIGGRDRAVYEARIRPAEEDDLDFIATLGGKAFPYIKQPRTFFLDRIRRGGVYVIEGEEPLGFVDVEDCKVMGIAVEEGHRGRGLGKKLLDFAITILSLQGCPKITLLTLASNEVALKLYEGAGFVIKERRGPVVVMVKTE